MYYSQWNVTFWKTKRKTVARLLKQILYKSVIESKILTNYSYRGASSSVTYTSVQLGEVMEIII